MKNLSLSLIICLSGLAATSHAADRLQDPYAICAHVSRGELAVAVIKAPDDDGSAKGAAKAEASDKKKK